MKNTTTVIGVFEQKVAASEAIQELQRMGFRNDQLGFVTRHDEQQGNASTEAPETEAETDRPRSLVRGLIGGVMGAVDVLLVPFIGPADASSILGTTLPVAEEAIDRLPYPGSTHDEAAHTRPDAAMTASEQPQIPQQARTDQEVHADERSSIVTGGVVGGVVGAAAALFIPGIGPALAGGILVATFGGAAIGGVAGGFLGTFIGMGVPQEKASYYENEFKAGRTIITVKPGDRQQDVITILRKHGAHDVEAHS